MKSPQALSLIVALFAASLAACAPKPAAANGATAAAAQSAWTNCVQSVQKQFKLSPAYAPAYAPAGITAQDGGKFTVNVYYAKTATNYRCGIQQNADGTWKLLSLDSLDASNLVIWGLKR